MQMALIGYQAEKEKLDAKIREIEAQLKGKKTPAPVAEKGKAPVKRVLSAAARARIAAAQRKRWAEHRKRAAAAKPGD
jgi:hypothetical protein